MQARGWNNIEVIYKPTTEDSEISVSKACGTSWFDTKKHNHENR